MEEDLLASIKKAVESGITARELLDDILLARALNDWPWEECYWTGKLLHVLHGEEGGFAKEIIRLLDGALWTGLSSGRDRRLSRWRLRVQVSSASPLCTRACPI